MRLYLLIILVQLFAHCSGCFAQAGQWAFSPNSGLDFNVSPASRINTGAYSYDGYSSGVCDCNGKLLLYGENYLLNKYHQFILDTTKSYPHYYYVSMTDGTAGLLIKVPQKKDLIYLLKTGAFNGNEKLFGLTYTLLDLSYFNDSGGVVQNQKRILFNGPDNGASRIITAAKHANGVDFWIIAEINDSLNNYHLVTYKLDSSGIDTVPIHSTMNFGRKYQGIIAPQIKVSHDGKSIALTAITDSIDYPDARSTLLFDFDNQTGKISNATTLLQNKDHLRCNSIGLEFSPNDSLIYISTQFDYTAAGIDPNINVTAETWKATNYLFQINRYTGEKRIVQSFRKKKPNDQYKNLHEIYGIQLGPDNKIYIVYSDTNIFYPKDIGIIHRPDEIGANCNLDLKVFHYNEGICWVLPNVYQPLNLLKFRSNLFGQPCRDTAEFTAIADSNYQRLTWYFGDGDSLVWSNNQWHKTNIVKHVYKQPGTYYVKIRGIKNECNYVMWYGDSVTINTPTHFVAPTFVSNSDCFGGALVFSDTLLNTNEVFIKWGDGFSNYGFPDANGELKLQHQYQASANYLVSIRLSNPTCQSILDTIIAISSYPKIASRLYLKQNDTLCEGESLTLLDTFSQLKSRTIYWGDGGNTSKQTFSEKDSASKAVHQYTNKGLYTVRLLDSSFSNCAFQDSFKVFVRPKPVLKYPLKDTIFCSQFLLTLKTGTQYQQESYNWIDITNQISIGTDSLLLWSQTGILEASVTNICGTIKDTIVIEQLTQPKINLDTLYDACDNKKITIDINNPNNQEIYQWSTTETTASITTEQSGNYWVRATNYCGSDTANFQVVLYPKPLPNFTVTDNCEGELADFKNNTIGGKEYEWRFGDGTISTDSAPNKRYAITEKTRTYFVTLVAKISKGCQDSIFKPLNVNATSDAGFTYSSQGKTVYFNQTGTELGESYQWYFGDGDSSTATHPTHQYKGDSGSYKVCLTITNSANCESQTCQTVQYSVGINKIDKPLFAVYPNPSEGLIHISFEKKGDYQIKIYDVLGREIHQSQINGTLEQIQLPATAKGSYLLKVVDQNGAKGQKVVVVW